MELSREDVRHIAGLARLAVKESEIIEFSKQLTVILQYMEALGQVDTQAVEPMYHPSWFQNVFRDDEVKDSLPNELALKNAPQKAGPFFSVPRVIPDGESG